MANQVVFTNKNIYTQVIPGWDNPPSIGGLAVLRLDLNKRYHNVVITSPTQPAQGTLFGVDIIDYISIKINGREQRRLTPTQLHLLNREHSRGGVANQYDRDDSLVIWFEEPWACENTLKDALCLGTGDVQIATIEFQIKSGLQAAPVLLGYWSYDLAQIAVKQGDTTIVQAAPLSEICRYVVYTPELSAGQNRKRNIPLNGLWRALHLFTDNITGAEIIVNNESVIKVERSNFALLQQLFNITDQNGLTSIWLSRGREDYGIQNSQNKNVELVLHMASAESPQCLVETVGGIL